MAVSVFAGKNILIFGQRTEIILLDKAHRQIAISRVAAALIGKKEIFRQRVGFVPGVGNILVRTCALFRAAQGFFWKMRHHCLRRAPVNIERIRISGELMRIDQSATGLVVGVGGQVVVDIKLCRRFDGLRKTTHQPMHFFLRGFVAGDRIGARQVRKDIVRNCARE